MAATLIASATISSAPIPVLIRLEPQRITHQNHEDTAQWRQEIDRMIGDGLRASLKPGNLLTGSLFVDLDFHPESPANSGGERYADVAVFPTVNSGGISKIEDQIQQLLDTLNDLPMESIAGNLNRARPVKFRFTDSWSLQNDLRISALRRDSEQCVLGGIGDPDGTIWMTIDPDRNHSLRFDHCGSPPLEQEPE